VSRTTPDDLVPPPSPSAAPGRSGGDSRIALLEAERRIRAIALVHDILAREATEQVPFEEIVAALVNMIRETSTISFT